MTIRAVRLAAARRFRSAIARIRPVLGVLLRVINLDGLIPALILAYGSALLIDPRAFWFVLGVVLTADYLVGELRPPKGV